MNVKEFLRPTKKKLITFIVLLVLVYFYELFASICPEYMTTISGVYSGYDVQDYTCGKLPAEGRIIFNWPFSLILELIPMVTIATNIQYMLELQIFLRLLLFLFALALNLLYLYVISNFVLLCIERVRKKK